MRFSAWIVLLIAIGLVLSAGCGGPSAEPPSPEQKKKLDEDMKKSMPNKNE
jgi:hypothetical protein